MNRKGREGRKGLEIKRMIKSIHEKHTQIHEFRLVFENLCDIHGRRARVYIKTLNRKNKIK